MELAVHERLILLSLLPQHGDLTTLRIIRSLREELSFSEEEHAVLQFENKEGRVHWSPTTGPMVKKSIDVGPKAAEIIKAAFDAASESKSLTEAHLAVYERIEDEALEAHA